jgi:hypothetical protein
MFRKLLLPVVASLGLLSSLALPASADAHEYRHEHRHAFHVYYRDPCRPGWVCAGTFRGYRAAERFAEQFRCRGFAVSIH